MKRFAVVAVVVIALGVGAFAYWRAREAKSAQNIAAAKSARLNGQFDQAKQLLESVPDSVLEAQLERAEVRLATGDLPGAYALLRNEAAKEPSDPHFWARYGFTAALMGNSDDAVSALTKAVTATPAEAEAATHLVQFINQRDREHATDRIRALEAQANEPAKSVFHLALQQ